LEHSHDSSADAVTASTGPVPGSGPPEGAFVPAGATLEGAQLDSAPSETPPPRTRVERARRARTALLIELLGDESNAVLGPVRTELLAAGRSVMPALRRAARSDPARMRARARTVLAHLERQEVVRRLAGYALRGDIDLERGLFLLSRLDHPAFDPRRYAKALDAMGSAVRARLAAAPDGPSAPLALAQYLGDELGFVGSENPFNHPDNVFLHRVIERKRGMPLTLVAIYLLVARRAGLKAAPIALPGRVLLRLYAGPRSLILDPFLGGKARTRQDCVNYLAKHGLVPRPQWFADASDATLFHRQILNLMGSHQARGHAREAAELTAIVAGVNRVRARRRAAK
jgi:regulator of sirC expression with transglutaminase-like and TPR domain